MLNLRVSAFNENGLGEPEQDANSALTELDKGLYILYFWKKINKFLFSIGQMKKSLWLFPKMTL